ncbi:MAG: ATP-binding cassette domain-containing protein [Actinomycetota bacterium]|nr:ATP-binding cassette domain-containing protein [Acidimicrobiia bacterium]MDQ3468227.1 ATP-binding cassette domain-containing protein [Actinomycetota bacterium]
MIELRNLTKRFGTVVAVDDLSFDVRPGRVTGFLGPNGSGKSTTMRCMLGLDRAERGVTTFDGRRFESFRRPLHEIGALLDAGYAHPGRSGRNHLRWLAASNGINSSRVDEVLALVGLTDVAGRKVNGYSLGMKQRLGLAGVLLGDPHTVILDEPANGLDPEGIRWIRDVLVHLARTGKTVLISSHLLAEVALMVDDLIVIGRGRLIEAGPVDRFIDRHATRWVRVRTPHPARFAEHLRRLGARSLEPAGPDGIDVHGLTIEQVGEAAASGGVVLHELSPQTASLEEAFLRATAQSQEYVSGGGLRPGVVPPPPPASPPMPTGPTGPPGPPYGSPRP